MNIEALIALNERHIAAWEEFLKQAESKSDVGPLAARAIEETRRLVAATRKHNEALRSDTFYSPKA